MTPAGVVSTFATGFNNPEGLAFDAAGNLYVANFGDNTVNKVTPAGAVSTFTDVIQPWGLAFDAAGNLYVSSDSGTVSKVTPAGVDTIFASGIIEASGLAFDGAGNLYVAAPFTRAVDVVTPTGAVSTFASGFNSPEYVAFDPAGNLYVSNESTSTGIITVNKVSQTVTVPFTLGGTAVNGVDYSGVTASPLTFGIGQTNANITGTLLPDPGASPTITFTLGTPTNAALGSPAVNTLTIAETPTTLPSVSMAFGPAGEVVELVNSAGVLTQFDATGAHHGISEPRTPVIAKAAAAN